MRTGAGVGKAGLVAGLLLLAGGSAAAQETGPPPAGAPNVAPAAPARPPRLSVTLPADPAQGAPVVRATGLLDDGVFAGAMHDGFAVRFQFRLELWRTGTFYSHFERDQSWLALAALDPLSGVYTLTRSDGTQEQFVSQDALARALAVPYTVEVPFDNGHRGSRYYYIATLDIASLSPSEFEDVEQWLRGDLGHALSREGSGDVSGALARGARRLLIRFSGLPSRRLEARSGMFRR